MQHDAGTEDTSWHKFIGIDKKNKADAHDAAAKDDAEIVGKF
jgi:hypothetical protein